MTRHLGCACAASSEAMKRWPLRLPRTSVASVLIISGALGIAAPARGAVTCPSTVPTASPARLTYLGPSSAEYADSLAAAAQLTDRSGNPLPNRTIAFAFGTQTVSAQSDAFGVAHASLTVASDPGAVTLTASFAGDATTQATSATVQIQVSKEETFVRYTGPSLIDVSNGKVSAQLTEADLTTPVIGKTVTFQVGSARASAVTDTSGIAVGALNSLLAIGPAPLTISFAGDTDYGASNFQAQVSLYALEPFVVWGGNPGGLRIGQQVNFWGHSWAQQVTGGDYDSHSNFKGYAQNQLATGLCESTRQTTTNPPLDQSCWNSKSGQSFPPASVPAYIGAIVSTSISQARGQVYGNVAALVLLQVSPSPAYGPTPGTPGFGTIVGVIADGVGLFPSPVRLSLKQTQPVTVPPGQPVSLKATLTNSSSTVATSVALTEAISGATPANESAAFGTVAGSSATTWTLTAPTITPRQTSESDSSYAARLGQADGSLIAAVGTVAFSDALGRFYPPVYANTQTLVALPRLMVGLSTPSSTGPGASTSYTVHVANIGNGPSKSALATLTLPDGSQQSLPVGPLAPGSSTTLSANWIVPAIAPPGSNESASSYQSRLEAVDGAILKASVSVSWTDAVNNAYGPLGQSTTSIERLPILSVSATSLTPLLPAQRAIVSYTIQNLGSAAAKLGSLVATNPDGTHVQASGFQLGCGQSTQVSLTLQAPAVPPRQSGETAPAYLARLHSANDQLLTFPYVLAWSDPSGTGYNLPHAEVVTSLILPIVEFNLTASSAPTPGSTMTFNTTYRNAGGALAEAPQLSITLPDGSTQRASISGPLAPRAGGTVAFKWTVPSSTPKGSNEDSASYIARLRLLDGTSLQATATSTWNDVLGGNYGPVSGSTVAHEEVPILEVSGNAPVVVNPGEPAPVVVTLRNIGSAPAGNAVVVVTSSDGSTISTSPLTLSAAQAQVVTLQGKVPTVLTKQPGESDATYQARLTALDTSNTSFGVSITWEDSGSAAYGPTVSATSSQIVIPVLTISLQAPGVAVPGETIHYTATINNLGHTSAFTNGLVFSFPDGSSQRVAVPMVSAGTSATITASWMATELPPRGPSESSNDYVARVRAADLISLPVSAAIMWSDASRNSYGPVSTAARSRQEVPLLQASTKLIQPLLPGESVPLQIAVTNVGAGDAPSGSLVVARLIGLDDTTPLAAASGKSETLEVGVTAPPIAPRSTIETDSAYLHRLLAADNADLGMTYSLEWVDTAAAMFGPVDGSAGAIENLPIVTVALTGPATAQNGTVVRYTASVSNIGHAAAAAGTLSVTFPDGTNSTLLLPVGLAPTETAQLPFSYEVPVGQPSGSLTVTASITWNDSAQNNYGPLSSTATTSIPSNRRDAPPIVSAGPNQTAVLIGNGNSNPPFKLEPIAAATNLGLIGVAYDDAFNQVLISVNYGSGYPFNFMRVAQDGTLTQFSSVAGLSDEVYMTDVRGSGPLSIGGFNTGDIFTGTGRPGEILRISADGKTVDNPWVTLPGEWGLLRGGLHVDDVGVFGGDLLVATTNGNIWRVNSKKQATYLASANVLLEGITVIPDDANRYGPWAGSLLTTSEYTGLAYAVKPSGALSAYNLNIYAPESVQLVPANENFYVSAYGAGKLLGAPASELVNMVGDVLIGSETGGGVYRVRWNGSAFETNAIETGLPQMEGAGFAPAGVQNVPPPTRPVQLSGSVTDADGLNANLTAHWSVVSGPGAVAFSDAISPQTYASFTKSGDYVLRLTGSDGVFTETSDVTISIVLPNQNPPFVRAGGDQQIILPTNTVTLNGTVSEAGLPSGSTLTTTWSSASGPAPVSFGNASSPQTTATFSAPGTYVLQLQAADGVFTRADQLTVIVEPQGYPVVSAGPSQVIQLPGAASLLGAVTVGGTPAGSSVNLEWSWVPPILPTAKTGKGPVYFASPNGLQTTASFGTPGLYVLQLKASDGTLTNSAMVSVQVNPETVPIVNAGPAQTITLPQNSVSLSGSVIENGQPTQSDFTVAWEVLSGPGTVFFSNPNNTATVATFDAPGVYLLELSASNFYQSAFATTEVVVNPTNRVNQPPQVSAGPSKSLVLPQNTVALAGTVTDDGLPSRTLTVTWTQVSGPGQVVFANPNIAATNATFPVAGNYVLQLSASDGQYTTWAQVGVQVLPASSGPVNQPPSVSAGPALTLTLPGDTATFNGSATDDGLPVGSTFTVSWSEVSGPGTVVFSNPSSAITTGHFSAAGSYVLQLSASDGQLTSSSTVNVQVNPQQPLNQPPSVSAGPSFAISRPNQSATLQGSVSDDGLPVGSTLSSQWTQVSGPGAVTFATPTLAATQAMFPVAGTYVLELRASDSQLSSSSQATVTVLPSGGSLPPTVSAGPSQTITLPTDTLTLQGSAVGGTPNGTLVTAWTAISRAGSVIFGNQAQPVTTATFSAAGTYVLELSASDGQSVVTSQVSIVVQPALLANQPPLVSAGENQSLTLPVNSLTLVGSVMDDGLPLGGALTIQWREESGPGVVTFNSPAQTSTTVTFPAAGVYVLQLSANDSQLNSISRVTVTVSPAGPQNQPPSVNAGPNRSINLPTTSVALAGVATDDGLPNGTLQSQWMELSGPAGVTFANAMQPSTTATFPGVGTYVLQLAATDSQLTSKSTVTIVVSPPQNQPPVVSAGPNQTLIEPTNVAHLTGSVSDDGLPKGSTVTSTWSELNGPGQVKFAALHVATTDATFPYPGTYVIQLSATDGELSSSAVVTVTVTPAPGSQPVIAFGSPVDGSEITAPTPIVANISNGTWKLEYGVNDQDGDSSSWTTLASGNGAISGTLATFDPTRLLNGIYVVRLAATTAQGESIVALNAVVRRNLKIGNFTLGFKDMTIPVAGLPIGITRTYDSRDKRVGDFGVGWHIAMSDVRVEKTGVLGRQWEETTDGSFAFPTYCLRQTQPGMVTVTFAGGQSFEFQPATSPACQPLEPISTPQLGFTQINGPRGTLQLAVSDPTVYVSLTGGSIPGPVELQDFDLNPVNATAFQLTTEDGTSFVVDQHAGLQSITDRNGNSLSFGPNGILHSSGKSVTFTRDLQNRITQITDPNGNSFSYAYDSNGNLASSTDRNGNTTSYGYDENHNLTTITDPIGVQPVRNTYDDSGRLVSTTDANGQTTTLNQDLANNQERITDRMGNSTIYTYDQDGNVIIKSDPLGHVTTATFDANDNKLSETDALGNKRTYTYDTWNHKLSETDALGNTTSYTYNDRGNPLTTTDPLGHVTTNGYDPFLGNLVSTTDALGNATRFDYSTTGVLARITAPNGAVTSYTLDNAGNYLTETNALGNVTSYTYDANGSVLSEARSRTTSAGVTTEVTGYQYDAQGHRTQVTYPDGSSTLTNYDSAGRVSSTADQFGRITKHVYNELGLLAELNYPDGTSAKTTYDADGRKSSSTDQAGRTTTYAYDALGRLTQTIFPDGTSQSSSYDSAGHPIATTDELGHPTYYAYDADGRRTAVTDALGAITATAYDAVGNPSSTTDPLGNATSYQYDPLGRRTQIIYADGTNEHTDYDTAGNRISQIDQAGVITKYGYDLLGQLTSVTDANGGVTRYSYDESANRISQTDANGHTTKFAFDSNGRLRTRTLTLGQSETRNYDTAGHLVSITDFNGRTTTFTYDLMGRLVTRTPDPVAFPSELPTTFTYSANGLRSTMSDVSGTTVYQYDQKNHLVHKGTPEGALTYTYDPVGRVSSVRSDSGQYSLDYAYDPVRRLTGVTDRALAAGSDGLATTYAYDSAGRELSRTLPSGTTISQAYDRNGRVISVTANAGSMPTSFASFTYTLDATGRRAGITEGSGRVVSWKHDALYRITDETVTGASVSASAIYSYDSVGNRLTCSSAVGPIGTQSLTFDPNDRSSISTWSAAGEETHASGGPSYLYDSQSRLIGSDLGGVRFVYDGDGNLVQRVTNGVATAYLIDANTPKGFTQVAEERQNGSVTRSYTYGSQRIAMWDHAGVHYFVEDAHSGVRAMLDSTGHVTDTFVYDAFGEVLERTGTTDVPFQYRGEFRDPMLGLDYLRARWMDSTRGRFVAMDPLPADPETPTQVNRYSYAENDPINGSDPTGLITVSDPIVGTAVHKYIEDDFDRSSELGRRFTNRTLNTIVRRLLPDSSDYFGALRPDLIAVDQNIHAGYIWEIKPNNPAALEGGDLQLLTYVSILQLSGYSWDLGTSSQYVPPNFSLPQFDVSVTTGYAESGLIAYDLQRGAFTKAFLATGLAVGGVNTIRLLVGRGLAAGATVDEAEIAQATELSALGGI